MAKRKGLYGRGTTADSAAARELSLYMDNDARLYRLKKAIETNLCRKAGSGKYDAVKAPKAFEHFAKAGAYSYCEDLGCNATTTFNAATRRAVAKEFAADFAPSKCSGKGRSAAYLEGLKGRKKKAKTKAKKKSLRGCGCG